MDAPKWIGMAFQILDQSQENLVSGAHIGTSVRLFGNAGKSWFKKIRLIEGGAWGCTKDESWSPVLEVSSDTTW